MRIRDFFRRSAAALKHCFRVFFSRFARKRCVFLDGSSGKRVLAPPFFPFPFVDTNFPGDTFLGKPEPVLLEDLVFPLRMRRLFVALKPFLGRLSPPAGMKVLEAAIASLSELHVARLLKLTDSFFLSSSWQI